MADDKKPKIDLKARLGKQGGAALRPAAVRRRCPPGIVPGAGRSAASGCSAPRRPRRLRACRSARPRGSRRLARAGDRSVEPARRRGRAVPPGAAASARGRASRPHAHRGRRRGRPRGAQRRRASAAWSSALIIAAVRGGVGFVAGGASEQGKAREKSKADAASLGDGPHQGEGHAVQARRQDGRRGQDALRAASSPTRSPKDLGGLNVAFDGTELAGRRFSGFPQETTAMLVDFITSVQALNDRKELVQGLLTKLQKPHDRAAERARRAPARSRSIAAVRRTRTGNHGVPRAARDAHHVHELGRHQAGRRSSPSPIRSGGGSNATRAALHGRRHLVEGRRGDPVVPKTFDKVCPSEAAGGSRAARGADRRLHSRHQGRRAPGSADVVTDTKAGLLERADKLLARASEGPVTLNRELARGRDAPSSGHGRAVGPSRFAEAAPHRRRGASAFAPAPTFTYPRARSALPMALASAAARCASILPSQPRDLPAKTTTRVPGASDLGARDLRRDAVATSSPSASIDDAAHLPVPRASVTRRDGGASASGFFSSSCGTISTFTMWVSSASRTMNVSPSTVSVEPIAGTSPGAVDEEPARATRSPRRRDLPPEARREIAERDGGVGDEPVVAELLDLLVGSVSYSSWISPTISSRMSSSVTTPAGAAELVAHDGHVQPLARASRAGRWPPAGSR